MDEIPKKHLFKRSNYLLDLEHLHALEQIAPEGNIRKFLSELCVVFLKEAPLVLQDLDKSVAKRDRKGLIQHSYRLKGMSSGLGATYMADLCQQIEKSLGDDPRDFSLAHTLTEQLKDAFLVTRDQIQAYVTQLPSA